eukprot:6203714-Pleurochrysis_carterae.AAC.2
MHANVLGFAYCEFTWLLIRLSDRLLNGWASGQLSAFHSQTRDFSPFALGCAFASRRIRHAVCSAQKTRPHRRQ